MWDLIANIFTGGVTGLIGALLSGVLEFFKQKQKNVHDLAILAAERETLSLEIQGRERVMTIEGETAQQIEASRLLSVSIASDRATYSNGESKWLVVVDVVRGLTRPILTLFLGVFMMMLWFSTDSVELQNQITTTVLYIATTCFFWWFGTRVKAAK